MRKFAKLIVTVELGEQTFEGFKNQTQAIDFVKLAQKAVMKAYRKATEMPREVKVAEFHSVPASILATAEGTDTSMLLDESDGIIKTRGSDSEGTVTEDSEADNESDTENDDDDDDETEPETVSKPAPSNKPKRTKNKK